MALICLTSTGTTLDSPLDPRFGRCSFFLIVNPETFDFKPIPNEAVAVSGGAGIQAAQRISSEGVTAVITGSVGPNAHTALASSGIQIFSAPDGTIRSAVEDFKQGRLVPIQAPGPAHVGAGRGGGRGRGRRGGY